MGTFRFVHAADIHLDSPLKGLSGEDSDVARRIRRATREAFENLVSHSVGEQVDFLILAGDLYDGDWKDYQTGLFFTRQMGRLNKAGIPVFIVQGNHDAQSVITRYLTLPDNVRVFSSKKPESFPMSGLDTVLHGQSFSKRAVTEDLAAGYPAPWPGLFNIGVLHTGLGGLGGHENYAPCRPGDLVSKGYDYWALGHVHQRQILHTAPHVVFPGNLQGRHIRETGDKGAWLVTVTDGAVTEMNFCPMDVVRWDVLTVEADRDDGLGDLLEKMKDVLASRMEGASERLLACRLILRGETPLHDRLTLDGDRLLAEARSLAFSVGGGDLWVEKVVLETGPVASGRGIPDGIDDLEALLAGALSDPELLSALAGETSTMVQSLLPDVRDDSEDPVLRAAAAGLPEAIVPHAMRLLLARMKEGEKTP